MGMAQQHDNLEPARLSAGMRARRAMIFVAVCWSLAAVLLLLQDGSAELLTLAVQHGWVPDSLLVPKVAETRTDCRATVERARALTTDPQYAQQGRYLAWLLGFKTGIAAGLVDSYAVSPSPPDSRSWMDQPRQIAAALRVAEPILPKPRHIGTALNEYAQFVAVDPQCIAAQLADRYAARTAALYRFGLIAGHAAVYRIRVPDLRLLYVAELREYGRDAGLPEMLWRPLTEPSVDALPGATIKDKVLGHLERIGVYVREGG